MTTHDDPEPELEPDREPEPEPEFDYGPDGPKRTVVCTNLGCPNAGVVITMPDDGSPVVCGPCGTNITGPSEPTNA